MPMHQMMLIATTKCIQELKDGLQIQDCYTGGGQKNMMHNTDIVIFNKTIGADRREVFLPTIINDVCWYGSRSLDGSGAASGKYAVRIPYRSEVEGRKTYVSEVEYARTTLEEKKHLWTLQKNCYVMAFKKSILRGRKELDPVEVLEIGKVIDDFFVVTEYADNTIRGTERTKHWRVGGS